MSYPSVKEIAAGGEFDTATEAGARAAIWQALQVDLPLAIAKIREMVAIVRETGQRELCIEDPNSVLGRQLVRIFGADVARSICEEQFEVSMGFYNCCGGIVALTREGLQTSAVEQIQLQNGVKAHADC